jgi:signal transduction histidine kinase
MAPTPLEFEAAALEAMPQAVLVVDPIGKALANNAAARESFDVDAGLPPAQEQASGHAVDWRAQLAAVAGHTDAVWIRNLRLSGRGDRLILADVFLRRLDHVPANAVLVVIDDVAERAAMARRLAAGQRLAALGQLAGQIAHELNNPLDGILRYISLAQRVADSRAEGYLDNARKGLLRMAEILRDMLGRAAPDGGDRTPIDKLLAEAVTVMQPPAHARGVAVVCDVDEAATGAMPGSVFQVFCNIIKNALDAMPQGGRLTVRLRREGADCVVEFTDTGGGIAPADAERIFQPFHTTTDTEGAGLGLAVCRNIVARLGGTVSAGGAEGGGAVITVRLPCRQGPAATGQSDSAPTSPQE